MAALALSAETTAVFVIGRMAGDTELRLIECMTLHRVAVAGLADQTAMGTFETEVGGLVVIELPERPTIRVMAACAIIAERLLVHVVLAVAVIAACGDILESRGGLTLFAGRSGMQANQREVRQIMIEYHLVTPAAFAVAARTILALLTAMDIVGAVTVDAAGLQFVREIAPMTGVAQDLLVLAAQREIGLTVVIEATLGPGLFGMTTFAAFAIASMMGVVGTVAGNTRRREFLGTQRLGVASFAGQLAMAAAQGKIGVLGVVKTRLVPLLFVVAIRALRTIAAAMHIVQRMTRIAVCGCFFITLVGMAGAANDLAMRTFKCEFGLGMVEFSLLPGRFGMTIGAFLTEALLMRIVLAMTCDTGRGGFTEGLVLHMAT